jgi:3-hydroxyisobutyrate dehydrogenase-like beta-hydroxyacid dehydrogenase
VSRIAFYGLGTMGLPMARNLVAAGHDVVGHDLDPARAAEFAVGGPAEIAIASLPSAAAVEEVARGLGPVEVFVDMSTSPPALARRLAEDLGARGIASLDAPVSGGPRGAEAATLSIFVGGAPEAFARVGPLLQALGSVVAHVGGPGAGQVVKLCNNLMAGVNMAAVAEASAVAAREGIDPKLFYELVTASTGDSRVLRTRYPRAGADESHPANREFEAMFMLDLIVKDMTLVSELAKEAGVEPDMAEAALANYRKAQQDGHGRLDYSAVFLSKSDTSQ